MSSADPLELSVERAVHQRRVALVNRILATMNEGACPVDIVCACLSIAGMTLRSAPAEIRMQEAEHAARLLVDHVRDSLA
jgi:hypothetical protein